MAEHGYPLAQTMVKPYGWAIAKRSGNGDRVKRNLGPVSIGGLISEKGNP